MYLGGRDTYGGLRDIIRDTDYDISTYGDAIKLRLGKALHAPI